MFDPVPLPVQAVLWPLVGAAIVLTGGRLLPNWLCRLVAFLTAMASLLALWSCRAQGVRAVEILWEPVNLFRTSPLLHPDGLSLLVGITLTGVTSATVLGVRGSASGKTSWHGLMLVVLAGCLLMSMATNMVALALGSALIDLALMAVACSTAGGAERVAWRMAAPGAASTLVLVFAAVQMSTDIGTVSLLASNLPERVLMLMGVAGMLRLMVYPLHPRGLNTPENAATLIPLLGGGMYLLARSQFIAPVLTSQSWMLVPGVMALLAGGLLVWPGGPWPGIAIHQAGFALSYAILLAGVVPWPVLSLAVALGVLVIWWDMGLAGQTSSRPGWFEWIAQRLETWWTRERSRFPRFLATLDRWGSAWPGRQVTVVLPVVALASLVGAPLTAGALGRWPLYAALLKEGRASMLLASMAADAFLVAGLWSAFRIALKQADRQRPSVAAFLAMLGLVILLIAVGIAPAYLPDALAVKPTGLAGVSVWGLGIIYAVPWLLGGWLARVGARRGRYANYVQGIVSLDWLFGAVDWIGQRLVVGIYWLGRVGEGQGWWGWVLIVLALGAIFLVAR